MFVTIQIRLAEDRPGCERTKSNLEKCGEEIRYETTNKNNKIEQFPLVLVVMIFQKNKKRKLSPSQQLYNKFPHEIKS